MSAESDAQELEVALAVVVAEYRALYPPEPIRRPFEGEEAMKTGAHGRAWVVLEKPKPPAVEDRYEFWADAPPQMSDRCAYWLRQVERGWLPNRRIRGECYDCSAEWYGVWIWEWLDLLWPAIEARTP